LRVFACYFVPVPPEIIVKILAKTNESAISSRSEVVLFVLYVVVTGSFITTAKNNHDNDLLCHTAVSFVLAMFYLGVAGRGLFVASISEASGCVIAKSCFFL
jgi:hypothetical protein